VAKATSKGKRHWREQQLDDAIMGDWTARRTAMAPRTKLAWDSALTAQDDWADTAIAHFESVFFHADENEVREFEKGIWGEVREKCRGAVREVTVEELMEVSRAWKSGKTSGPDGITYEALRAILEHPAWGTWLAGMFTGVLREGRLPAAWAKSMTVLLPKTSQPGG
jgi:hypothetical protein